MAFQTLRPAAVAGLFYPSAPHSLSAQVEGLFALNAEVADIPPPKAMIVPHAGYIYSGPIAASAYKQLEALRDTIRRVVLLGPSHRVSFSGIALPGSSAFSTPLGNVEIDHEAVFSMAQCPGVVVDDRPHAQEHSLEVQLPFLQSILGHFRLLPMVLGHVEPQTVAEILESVWGGAETLILASSDLSHYLPYASAQVEDGATSDQILNLNGDITHQQACGATAINALLQAAAHHRLTPRLLDLRNSGDTAGDRNRVVGYAAFSFGAEALHTH